ncbi:MAG: protein-tyrosine phosphatase family protein [Acidimicrobiales bacterium]
MTFLNVMHARQICHVCETVGPRLVGRQQIRPDIEHVSYRLIDHAAPQIDPNLDFMLVDAARTIAALRHDGHDVLLHCVAAQSRTPAVATAYSVLRGVPADRALEEVLVALPAANPNPGFRADLHRLAATTSP